MFSSYFAAASDHLRQIGWNPLIILGESITERDIEAVDRSTDQRMPSDLRRFYLELGDAFRFEPDDRPDSTVSGWAPMCLLDHAIHNRGFSEQIEEEAFREIKKTLPRVDPKLLRKEAERRKEWVPFYDFTGGGDLLCLDALGRVRFYEALYWSATSETWSFVLAESFTDFVERWSRYCFITPGSSWASFCIGRSGIFDWSPEYFPRDAIRR